MTVFIDESGTLPDPKDKVIVVAAVGTDKTQNLLKLIRKTRKIGLVKSGELKFYTAGKKTKIRFFEALAKEDLAIFVLVVDKLGRKITDSPENFAALCWLLLKEVLEFYNGVPKVVFDRHFFRKIDQEEFDGLLKGLLDRKMIFDHVDSQENKVVNMADMVAGAVLAFENGKDREFFNQAEKKIVSWKKFSWTEVKRRFLAEKNLLEPV